MNIITRFAPSPSGYLHIGNIRTALYSWLYARKNKGKFLLRIEDTNLNISKQHYILHILKILEWLGLYWDNDVYYQSKRYDFYKDKINDMLDKNQAYKCYCTEEKIINIKKKCLQENKKYLYNRFCRNKILLSKNKYVVRFKNPIHGYTSFNDYIFGNIKVSNLELDDIIIQRSNGIPTYNFCVAIDDYDMSITHIIRGQDHLSNTPKQVNILHALKYTLPVYVHLPILLNNNDKKLSKRNFDSNINYYINEGFLPDSILNYLLRLGWSYKNKEIISIEEMKYLFNLSNIRKSPCKINISKFKWINKYYISSIAYNKLFFYLKPFFKKKKINFKKINNITEIITFFSQHCSSLREIFVNCLLFDNRYYLNNKKNIILKFKKKRFLKLLKTFLMLILKIFFWNLKNINRIINIIVIKFFFIKKKDILMSLRFFLTFENKTISLDKLIYLLGKKSILFRIKYLVKFVLKS